MSKSRRKSRVSAQAKHYNRLGLLAILLIVAVFLAGFAMRTRSLEIRLAEYDRQIKELTEELEQEKARTKEIQELKEYMTTDQYAEEVARERLGLVKGNEIVFEEKKDSN